MEHTTWIEKITEGDSAREVGRKSGIPFRTITTQINKNKISAENVILIAMAYEAHPVRALVDCDYLEAKYAATTDPATALKEISDDGLASEVLRRLTRVTKEEQNASTLTSTPSEIEERNSNIRTLHVAPLSDDEIAAAIREANEQPQAAHPADETEYTEPDHP